MPPHRSAEPRPLPLAVSPDGTRVASGTSIGGSQGLHVWDIASGKVVARRPEYLGRPVEWMPDGKTVVYLYGEDAVFLGVDDGAAHHFPLGHAVQDFEDMDPTGAQAIALSPDGTELVSVGYDYVLKLFDVGGCRELASVELGAPSTGFVSISAKYVTGATSEGVKVFDRATREMLTTLTEGHSETRAFGLIAPDESFVIAGAPSDYSTAVFDADGWRLRRGFLDPNGLRAALSPDGKTLATWGHKPVVLLHSVDGEGRVEIALPSVPGGVGFTPAGILTSHVDEGLVEWATLSGAEIRRFEKP